MITAVKFPQLVPIIDGINPITRRMAHIKHNSIYFFTFSLLVTPGTAIMATASSTSLFLRRDGKVLGKGKIEGWRIIREGEEEGEREKREGGGEERE